MLTRIAWRNVWRNKTRSLVIITAVALGLWGGIFSDAFMQGMAEQQIYSIIHTETGHIQLNQPGFLLNHDMQMQIKNADSILAAIKTNPAVDRSFCNYPGNCDGIYRFKFIRHSCQWHSSFQRGKSK